MKSRKQFRHFCGIDVAKDKHVARIIDRDGQSVLHSCSFNNDAQGYQRLLELLQKAGGPDNVLVGMEATGHYWYGVHEFLVGKGYQVAVLNPIQTKQQAKKAIRKSKTDKIDARHIAMLLKNGEYKPAVVPDDLGMTCRQLTRLRHSIIDQGGRLKQLLWSRLHPVWPEYEGLFDTPFCVTGKRLLWTAPTPADVLAMDPDELVALIRKTSRGWFGVAQGEKIIRAATNSVGIRRGLDGARIGIRSVLQQIETLSVLRKDLEGDITDLANRLPGYILTLPGADPIRGVSLYGETTPIETFGNPSQLVAFAGLDLVVFQTGNYDGPTRHVSKRGSPHLRRTLWGMAHRAVYHEGDLKNYYRRMKGNGLHHLAAITATAIKLCHVVWRILTDRRDYLPEDPNKQS